MDLNIKLTKIIEKCDEAVEQIAALKCQCSKYLSDCKETGQPLFSCNNYKTIDTQLCKILEKFELFDANDLGLSGEIFRYAIPHCPRELSLSNQGQSCNPTYEMEYIDGQKPWLFMLKYKRDHQWKILRRNLAKNLSENSLQRLESAPEAGSHVLFNDRNRISRGLILQIITTQSEGVTNVKLMDVDSHVIRFVPLTKLYRINLSAASLHSQILYCCLNSDFDASLWPTELNNIFVDALKDCTLRVTVLGKHVDSDGNEDSFVPQYDVKILALKTEDGVSIDINEWILNHVYPALEKSNGSFHTIDLEIFDPYQYTINDSESFEFETDDAEDQISDFDDTRSDIMSVRSGFTSISISKPTIKKTAVPVIELSPHAAEFFSPHSELCSDVLRNGNIESDDTEKLQETLALFLQENYGDHLNRIISNIMDSKDKCNDYLSTESKDSPGKNKTGSDKQESSIEPQIVKKTAADSTVSKEDVPQTPPKVIPSSSVTPLATSCTFRNNEESSAASLAVEDSNSKPEQKQSQPKFHETSSKIQSQKLLDGGSPHGGLSQKSSTPVSFTPNNFSPDPTLLYRPPPMGVPPVFRPAPQYHTSPYQNMPPVSHPNLRPPLLPMQNNFQGTNIYQYPNGMYGNYPYGGYPQPNFSVPMYNQQQRFGPPFNPQQYYNGPPVNVPLSPQTVKPNLKPETTNRTKSETSSPQTIMHAHGDVKSKTETKSAWRQVQSPPGLSKEEVILPVASTSSTSNQPSQNAWSSNDLESASSLPASSSEIVKEPVKLEPLFSLPSSRRNWSKGDLLFGTITYFYSPVHFYIRLDVDNDKAVDRLANNMLQYYSNPDNLVQFKTKEEAKAAIGNYGASLWTADNQWYRVEIIEWDLADDFVSVAYVDYGNADTVEWMNLQPLGKDFSQYAIMTVRCSLQNIQPLGSNEWEKAVLDYIATLYDFGQLVQITVEEDHTPECESLIVDLVLRKNNNDRTIRELLIEKRFAANFEGGIEEEEHSEVTGDEVPDPTVPYKNWDPMKEDFESMRNSYDVDPDDACQAVSGYAPKDDARICQFFKKDGRCWKTVCTKEHVLPHPDAFTTDTMEAFYTTENRISAPEINSELKVKVQEVVSLNRFYAQLPPDFTKLDLGEEVYLHFIDLFNQLNDRTNVKCFKPLSMAPALGELILAKHDDLWYRAKVTDSEDVNDNVQVFFVDCGSSASVPMKNLRQMQSKYLQLPFQAVECLIVNICPRDDLDESSKEDGLRFLSDFITQNNPLVKVIGAAQLGNTENTTVKHYYGPVLPDLTAIPIRTHRKSRKIWIEDDQLSLEVLVKGQNGDDIGLVMEKAGFCELKGIVSRANHIGRVIPG